jgi:putative ABC transport system permease protein
VNYAVVAFILVLLLSFSAGATRNISTSLMKSSAGHITITGQFAKGGRVFNGLLRTDDILSGIRDTFGSDATTIVRYSVKSTVYSGGLSKRLSFSGIDTGTDKDLAGQATFLAGSWADFVDDPNGVAVPMAEAEYFGFGVGDEIVISSRTRFGAFNTGILTVRAIYESQNYFAKSFVLAHFDFLRNLDLGEADASTFIYVYLPSTNKLSEKRDLLSANLASVAFEVRKPANDTEAISAVSSASPKYEEDKEGRDRVMLTLSTLDEVLGIVRTVLAAVNGIGAFIAAVMLFVIAVSIFINLRMSINERLREIGTMRAMGVEAGSVTSLFVFESVSLAVIFSALGALLAAMVAIIVRYTLTFPSGGNLALFLEGGHLVLIPQPLAIIGVVAVISAFAAFFSYFPARAGGSIPPVEALTKTF